MSVCKFSFVSVTTVFLFVWVSLYDCISYFCLSVCVSVRVSVRVSLSMCDNNKIVKMTRTYTCCLSQYLNINWLEQNHYKLREFNSLS